MKRTKQYTKSRLHEKLDKAKKAGCSILGIILAGTLAMSVLAKENGNNAAESELTVTVINGLETTQETTEVDSISNIGTQRVIEIKTLSKEYNTKELLTSENMTYIRCTAYCDTGYTASGAWTTEGCLAGRKEWLGRRCRLYRVNSDGTPGDCIGTYTFKDTGFGLEELEGISYPNGTIKSGASIDMWHPTEEECWAWVAKYGDYVYMEFIQ